jgi:uncharacterized protein YkwD
MCIVSPRELKPLLSRVTPAAAILLLMAVALSQSPQREQVAVAQSTSLHVNQAAGSSAVADPASDHALVREISPTLAPPSPTPAPLTAVRRSVARARATAKPSPQPAAPAAPAPAIAGSGAGQFALINQDRAAAGLPPLQWNACLANIAVGQAQRMAAQGYISHANGRTLDLGCHLGHFASESIGVTYGHIDDAGMNAWFMNDPIHRDNIMGPYHYVGACWVQGANNRFYLAIEFG